MPSLTRRTMLSILCALVAGTALRLWFIHAFPQIQGDYSSLRRHRQELADPRHLWPVHHPRRWQVHRPSSPLSSAYPATRRFSPSVLLLFGSQNYSAVLYLQLLIDLATCLLIAGFVARICGPRAAMAALWLAALCPFTANYVAMPLTETPSIFCVALGLYAFAAVLEKPSWKWILALAFALSYAALLRPDGALLAVALLPALIFYGSSRLPQSLRVALICGLLSLLPFAAWTLRNWHTFHVFQPLAPRSATDPGEPKASGFQLWTKTWLADFASTYEIYWNVPGDEIDIHTLPTRALDGDERKTLDLIAHYNAGDVLTPQLDARFAALAAERIRAHPVRYYVTLPLLRLADMWFRPRVEMLDIELRWWQYRLHHAETQISYAYGALNLLYLLAALIGLFYWPRFATAMVAYIVLRCLLLATLDAPEPRYTLECFPMIIAFASAAVAKAWPGPAPSLR